MEHHGGDPRASRAARPLGARLDVTIFAHVKLSTQGRDAIAAFAEAIRERPEVLDCYTTMASGISCCAS